MNRIRTAAALLRFQLAAGARVALRSLAPVAAGAVAAAVMYGSPMVVVVFLRGLFFSPLPSIGGAIAATGILLAIALSSAPRLTLGLAGWARHLPASGIAFRRAATAGLAVAQLPILALVLIGGLAALTNHPSATWPRLLALLPLGWATSLAVLPVERPWTRALAVMAAISVWFGTWTGLAVGMVLVAAADLMAGAIVTNPKNRGRQRRVSGSA